MEAYPPTGCPPAAGPSQVITVSLEQSLPVGHPLPGLLTVPVPTPVCKDDPATLESNTTAASTELAYGQLALGFSWQDLLAFLEPRISLATWDELVSRFGSDALLPLAQMPDHICHPHTNEIFLITDGSFTAHQTHEPCCGWACVVVDAGENSLGAFSGTFPPWHDFQAYPASAYLSECYALACAAWFAAASLPNRELVFVADCTSALFGASGQQALDVDGPPGLMKALHQLCQARRQPPCQYRYAPAHVGNRYNELADYLAKAAARQVFTGAFDWRLPHTSIAWWARGGAMLTWFSLVLSRSSGNVSLPLPWGGPLGTDVTPDPRFAESLVAPFLPPEAAKVSPSSRAASELYVRVASYNVLTLAGAAAAPDLLQPCPEGLAYRPARAQLLAQSLLSHDIHVAGLQETRCEAGNLHTGHYTRFSGGAHKGHLGVELWFKRGHVLCRDPRGKGCIRFRDNSFAVLHATPRCIIVQFAQQQLRINFASLHAPHRATESHAISAWWRQHIELVKGFASQAVTVLCGDCNAAVGDVTSDAVGDHQPEHQDTAGEWWHLLLHEAGAWCPCTFAAYHRGPGWTFQQRRNGRPTRADYVAIPSDWSQGEVSSWIEPAIHAVGSTPDHYATAVQVRLTLQLQIRHCKAGLSSIDVNQLGNPANREKLASILRQAPRIPWEVSSHSHAAQLVTYLQSSLSAVFPRPKSGPRQPYLTEDTWRLHSQLATARHVNGRLLLALRSHWLRALCHAWAAAAGVLDTPPGGRGWFAAANRAGALLSYGIRFLGDRLRKACRQDRYVYLCQLADDVQAGGLAEAYPKLRRLLGHRRKKPWVPDTLPTLRKSDGSLCGSPEEIAERWREHFSALEGGREVSAHDLLHNVSCRAGSAAWPLPADLSLLPTLTGLQNILLKAKRNKAAGPDKLPAEIGIFCLLRAGSAAFSLWVSN